MRAEGAAGTRREPATVAAFGRHPTISDVRRAAALLGAGGLGLLLLGGLPLVVARRGEEVASIRRRYGDSLVEIAPGERPAGVERRVATMDALARIAERYERLILHERRDGLDAFLVEDGGIVYRHDVVHGRPPAEEPEPELGYGWAPSQRVRPLAEDPR